MVELEYLGDREYEKKKNEKTYIFKYGRMLFDCHHGCAYFESFLYSNSSFTIYVSSRTCLNFYEPDRKRVSYQI